MGRDTEEYMSMSWVFSAASSDSNIYLMILFHVMAFHLSSDLLKNRCDTYTCHEAENQKTSSRGSSQLLSRHLCPALAVGYRWCAVKATCKGPRGDYLTGLHGDLVESFRRLWSPFAFYSATNSAAGTILPSSPCLQPVHPVQPAAHGASSMSE